MEEMKIGERIANRRKQLNMTVDELSEKLGKGRATVYRYENGEIEKLPLSILEPLASALCTTPAYLMGWDSAQAAPQLVDMMQIPIIGEIACGTPALADDNIMGYWPVPTMLLHGSKAQHFILQAKGDSMSGSRIYDGDYVLIKCQQTAENGQIVAALVNGDTEATLKRIKIVDDMILLEATNPDFETQVYKSDDVRIQGIAVSNIIPRL